MIDRWQAALRSATSALSIMAEVADVPDADAVSFFICEVNEE